MSKYDYYLKEVEDMRRINQDIITRLKIQNITDSKLDRLYQRCTEMDITIKRIKKGLIV